MEFNTKLIHIGNEPDATTGAVIPPIYQTSTFVQKSPGVHQGYEYSRSHNPTRTRLEENLAALEEGKHALVTSSGMSAVMLLMHALPPGSRILCGDDVYGGTYRLFTTVFHDRHEFEFVDMTDLKLTKKKINEQPPQMIWLESPTNPTLKIADIEAISSLAQKHNSIVVVDNTFMSPYFQRPLKWGAQVVLHSMTKYINGHSDVVGGALIFKHKKLFETCWILQNSIGPSQSPFDSWLVMRGLKTLAVRMQRHQDNALALAQWLGQRKEVERVLYPGLPSHPQHQLAKKQMSGFGGMITFYLKGGLSTARKFLKNVEYFALAESLGGVESLIEHPGIMTHASVPAAKRKELGISDQLIRLSVGIEALEDLKKGLLKGFKAL